MPPLAIDNPRIKHFIERFPEEQHQKLQSFFSESFPKLVEKNIITLESFLQLSKESQIALVNLSQESQKELLSQYVRSALTDKVITLEDYLLRGCLQMC